MFQPALDNMNELPESIEEAQMNNEINITQDLEQSAENELIADMNM
jgi:hypothetical protein